MYSSEGGQARFAGALHTGLDKEFGLGSVGKDAVHLTSCGFEVVPLLALGLVFGIAA